MKTKSQVSLMIGAIAAAAAFLAGCASMEMGSAPPARNPPETSLSAEARAALAKLTADVPAAASLAQGAKGVLVFPGVTKGGFIVGGFHGEGVMLKQGAIHGYYDTGGATYGLQAGLQNYGYALFFMSDSALQYVDNTQGWEIGVGPSVVIVDAGMGKSLTTTTANKDVYGFIFDQKGLMAGIGLQGSKIVRVDK
ncbi:MAG: lipid-binding SYLF domain-containing protein [Verrucomicrobia subdivision 3 bacterium]|nr:lipid-binding SYLF domain-containing protein [Limisphaerales bacterium]